MGAEIKGEAGLVTLVLRGVIINPDGTEVPFEQIVPLQEEKESSDGTNSPPEAPGETPTNG